MHLPHWIHGDLLFIFYCQALTPPTFKPAWLSLPVLPGSFQISNPAFSLLSPALSHPSFPIFWHTSMQPRTWEPSSIFFPRFCPLHNPSKASGPPEASLKPPGAEAPLSLSGESQCLLLFSMDIPSTWPSSSCSFLSSGKLMLGGWHFCWAAQGFFHFPFLLPFSAPILFPFSFASFIFFRLKPESPSCPPWAGHWEMSSAPSRTSLHPPLQDLCLQGHLSDQTMYSVAHTSFVYY